MTRTHWSLACTLAAATLIGCQNAPKTASFRPPENEPGRYHPVGGPRLNVAVGAVQNGNRSGVFSGQADAVCLKAQEALALRLSESHRFVVVDRLDMQEAARDARIGSPQHPLTGGQVIVSGSIVELGRRELEKGGRIAFARVILSVSDPKSSRQLCCVEGAATCDLNAVVVPGREERYQEEMADKALNLAMVDAIDQLAWGVERNAWKPLE